MKGIVSIVIALLAYAPAAFSQSPDKGSVSAEDIREQAIVHTETATKYYYDGDFTRALDYYFKALPLAQSVGDQRTEAVSYHGIGSVYMETENYDDAITYLGKAQHLFAGIGADKNLGRVLNTIGSVYYMQAKDSLSEVCYTQALKVCQAVNDSACLNDGYKNLGALYFEMGGRGDTIKGAAFIKKSLDYIRPTDTLNLFQGRLSLAELYVYGGYLSEAKPYLDYCARLLPHISALPVIDDYYYCLHRYHMQTGDFRQALDDYKLYKIFQDSILNIEISQQLAELNVQYETGQKEKQIQLLHSRNEKQRLMIIIMILTTGMLAMLGYLLFVRYKRRQKRKKYQELQMQKEAERVRIARDMHDEIGAGLTRIVMRSEQVKRRLQSGNETPGQNGIVETLEKMADESQEISRNIGEIIWALNPKNDSFDSLWAYIRSYAFEYLEEVNIACNIHFPDNIPQVPVSPELRRNTFLIVKESLHNIVKHSDATEVALSLKLAADRFSVCIKDNGKGVAPGISGSGNGLENMKKRTEEIGGKFSMETHADGGAIIAAEHIPFRNTTKV